MNAPRNDEVKSAAGCFKPGYAGMSESGELLRRAEMLEERLGRCDLCPRACGADRKNGKTGFCKLDSRLKVAAVNLHHWEEPPISGTSGSGTIFFSGCTMACIFCQNYPISQYGVGEKMSVEELASEMLGLRKKGAHNINLVTPTHQIAGVVRALVLAAQEGLDIPIVYNTSGYESLDTLAILDGIIDIYLPDIKYSDSDVAKKYSGVDDYARHNRAALVEMWRQVGPLRTDSRGIALKGMIVRHLVLPQDLSGTAECLSFLAEKISPEVWISLMNQYFPAYKGQSYPPFDRRLSEEEYEAAFQKMTDLGLLNGFAQGC